MLNSGFGWTALAMAGEGRAPDAISTAPAVPDRTTTPTNAIEGAYLAAAYIQLREPARARTILDRLIKLPDVDAGTLIAAAQTYSQMGDYGAYGAEYGEDYSGYVRETEPRYNAGCPMPTNVHGYGDVQAVDGYVRPSTVNPTCGQFTPQPKQSSVVPDGFKPLW